MGEAAYMGGRALDLDPKVLASDSSLLVALLCEFQ